MAVRKPLVVVQGEIRELPTTDSIDTNAEGVPVFVSATAPVTTSPSYVWFKTGMPNGGTDILIETGP